MNGKSIYFFLILLLFSGFVSAQNILKENGSYIYQDSVYDASSLEQLLLPNSSASLLYQEYKLKRQYANDGYIAGTLLMTIGGGYAIYELKKECNGGPCLLNGAIGLGIGLLGVIINLFAVGNEVKSYNKLNQAIDVFNSTNNLSDSKSIMKFDINSTSNGIGLIVTF